MHRSHPSRGRILFEVLCALTVAASLAGAWMQTGATAMLPAAAAAALYGLVHLFDLRRPKLAEEPASSHVEEPQRVEFARVQEPEACVAVVTPLVQPEPMPAMDRAVEAAEPLEAAAPQPKAARKAKAPRKGGGRRASGPREATIAEMSPAETTDVTPLAPPDEIADEYAPQAEAEVVHLEPPETEPIEFARPAEAEVTHVDLAEPEHAEPASRDDEDVARLAGLEAELGEFPPVEEAAHPQIAPLFEPEPFARMQRRAFGRRGRI